MLPKFCTLREAQERAAQSVTLFCKDGHADVNCNSEDKRGNEAIYRRSGSKEDAVVNVGYDSGVYGTERGIKALDIEIHPNPCGQPLESPCTPRYCRRYCWKERESHSETTPTRRCTGRLCTTYNDWVIVTLPKVLHCWTLCWRTRG